MKFSLLKLVPAFLRPPGRLPSSAAPKPAPPLSEAPVRRNGKVGYIPIWIGGQALPYIIKDREE